MIISNYFCLCFNLSLLIFLWALKYLSNGFNASDYANSLVLYIRHIILTSQYEKRAEIFVEFLWIMLTIAYLKIRFLEVIKALS